MKTNLNPKITVLMPVYNCELYIRESIESVLNQTFGDFEFIIIDDASTDNTVKIIKTYNDSRVQLIEKPKNSGYTDSLNYGIKIAKGKYIARMDGDDICVPNRFEKQLNCLEKDEKIILCGTGIQIINSEIISKHVLSYEEILVHLCFGTTFHHPTVMIRKEVLEQNKYDRNYEPAEDYELWTRLAFHGKMLNLDDVLVKYRIHENQVSNTKSIIQKNNIFLCSLKMLNLLEVSKKYSEKQLRTALEFTEINTFNDCVISLDIFNYLIIKNEELKIFDSIIFKRKVLVTRIGFLKKFKEIGPNYKISRILFLFKMISMNDFQKVYEIKKNIKMRFSRFNLGSISHAINI